MIAGGWGGCKWFSHAVQDAASRKKFSESLESVVDTFGLDGIDFDWEYPDSSAAGNPHAPADAYNFLALLNLLRASWGPSKIISAAVAHLPWFGPNGKPLTDVAQFSAILSYVNIMNYDVHVASSTPGPNAPLGEPSETFTEPPQLSARTAFIQWTSAGFPASKLLLGLPLYGYVSESTATVLADGSRREPFLDLIGHPHGQEMTATRSVGAGDLSGIWGQQIAFKRLVQLGVLQRQDNGTYTASYGYTQGWDGHSATPFLYDVARKTVVTYDDPRSIAAKVKFAKEAGMAGCFTWSCDQCLYY
ncbi:hypothetical protein H0H92_012239 [Tricholoma furcatifolium]|nr:hypothetical protein H0H92_012239 [Tricholoma furcatifolium]